MADASPAGRARTGLPLAREREPRAMQAGDGDAFTSARGHSLPSPGRCCPGARAQAALHHRGDVRPQPASPRGAARPPELAGHGEGSEQACGGAELRCATRGPAPNRSSAAPGRGEAGGTR